MEKEKPALILLHGGPGFDESYFYPFLNPLKDNYILHSYTLGSSSKDYTFKSLISELESVIAGIDKNEIYILAHSFSSILTLNLSEKTLHKITKIILSNWIYNSEWIENFYENYPEERNYLSQSMRDDSFHYLKYYFNDQEKGRDVLSKIKFNDNLQKTVGDYYLESSHEKNLGLFHSKIFSISSDFDKITTKNYILTGAQKFNLKNFNIEDSSHFPFVDTPNDFLHLVRHIFKKQI